MARGADVQLVEERVYLAPVRVVGAPLEENVRACLAAGVSLARPAIDRCHGRRRLRREGPMFGRRIMGSLVIHCLDPERMEVEIQRVRMITLDAGKIYTVFANGFVSGSGAQALGAEIILNRD